MLVGLFILGPVLYNVYINDIFFCIENFGDQNTMLSREDNLSVILKEAIA